MMFFAAKGPTTTSYIWTDPLSRVAEVIQRTGRHYEYDLLWAIAEKAPEGIYFDVGAHVGNHTSFFALECPSTKVIAVEPHQETVGFLRQTVARNQIEDKVQIVPAAIHNDWQGCQVESTNDRRRIITNATQATPCLRLDDLVTAGEKAALIKADVDGLEASVLLSGERLIKRDHPLLALEAWTPETEESIRAVLEPWGYVQGPRYCATPTHIWEWHG